MSGKNYELVANDGCLKTYRIPVEGGWLHVTTFSGTTETSVASTFVPATVVEKETAEGLSDVSRAKLALELARSEHSSADMKVLVEQALELLGGPLL